MQRFLRGLGVTRALHIKSPVTETLIGVGIGIGIGIEKKTESGVSRCENRPAGGIDSDTDTDSDPGFCAKPDTGVSRPRCGARPLCFKNHEDHEDHEGLR